MATEFTFYDYVDDRGVNVISEWLHGPGKGARARMNQWISHLEGLKPGTWGRPHWDALDGECKGLYELRKTGSPQFRLLACFGPEERTVTILAGGFEKGNKFEPANLCAEAFGRMEKVFANAAQHRREHDVR